MVNQERQAHPSNKLLKLDPPLLKQQMASIIKACLTYYLNIDVDNKSMETRCIPEGIAFED